MEFLIATQGAKPGFSAYSPGLPGYVVTGAARRIVAKAMRKAIEFHLEGLRESCQRIPTPYSYAAYVDIPA